MKAETHFVAGDFCIETQPDPCCIAIFGASGDLTSRKLIPALCNLYKRNLLPEKFYMLGCARTKMSDDEFRAHLQESLSEHCRDLAAEQACEFLSRCYYMNGDYNDIQLYESLKNRMSDLDSTHETGGNHIFYLAIPPNLLEQVVAMLRKVKLTSGCKGGACVRVIVEKPFGKDPASAHSLDKRLRKALDEHQIYRIDHYLGKETVQNIMMFRFANTIFEPIWNHEYVDHVQITAAESIGVGHRAGYYEQTGVVRDMFQNHMLQMLSLVAMEPPASFDADAVRDEKVKLLKSIRPFERNDLSSYVARGQYLVGEVGDEGVVGYHEEEGVASDSSVDTYAAMKLMIDNKRWKGVPFYLRSGKRLAKRMSEIAIVFKQTTGTTFDKVFPHRLPPDMLVLNVQPEEGVSLTIQAKHPGPKLCMGSLTMNFKYREDLKVELSDAYERLLLDCMLGDQTLFVRSDGMEMGWKLIAPIIESWYNDGAHGEIPIYPAGSWGPKEADQLIERDGRKWRNS